MTASTGTTAAWPLERAGRLPVAWAVLGVAAALAAGAALVLAAGLRVQDARLGGQWLPGWLGVVPGLAVTGGGAGAGVCLAWDRLRRRRGLPGSHPLGLAGAAWIVTAATSGLVWLVVSL